jgi:hypothetical protein
MCGPLSSSTRRAKIEVIEYLREKVACRPCQAEVTLAPGPAQRLIDGASPGPQMLAAADGQ